MFRFLSKITLCLILLPTIAPKLHACTQAPGYGFIIVSTLKDNTGPFPVFSNISGQSLSGSFVSGQGSTAGSTAPFSGVTSGSGTLSELGKATPATWNIVYQSGPCSVFDPLIGPNNINVFFIPSSTPQRIVCTEIAVGDSLSASPSSYDTSIGTVTYEMTMTDGSEAWSRTPATWVNYDLYGNVMQTGSIAGVTDSYNCWAYYTPFFDTNHGASGQYIWLTDANGEGIGYASITVTNGTGG